MAVHGWACAVACLLFAGISTQAPSYLKLTETSLRAQLTDAEWAHAIGNHDGDDYSLATIKHHKRRKRDLHSKISIESDALDKALNIQLKPTENILDPNFLFVRRWENRSEPVEKIPTAEDLETCLYRNHQAALSFCGGVRGVIAHNNNLYTVHPLPERFSKKNSHHHVIIRRSARTGRDSVSLYNHDETQHFGDKTATKNVANNKLVQQNIKKVHKWSKYRRKADDACTKGCDNDNNTKLDNTKQHDFINPIIFSNQSNFNIENESLNHRSKRSLVPAVFVETAVFVDRDLHKHMTVNYPKETERELVRFVLAMINAVQLLYHDPTLGQTVNFVLKRLEILHEDPVALKRPHDIDRFLSNFCAWQRLENPTGDNDPLHWDHALILTGLDLYVVSKHGKVSSQVVGLAPVAGMCTVTSSCTVNEGRHFESVYVVAHEIGHNLGMRHDGPLAENECDPSSFIMSPTLGSGKITWSSCSRRYLQNFLDTQQSRCLLDHGSSAGQLDHNAEGLLPGERFGADQQCMLKYGRESRHASQQPLAEVCRDLHCRRERYTWTSHPALEGTRCGENKWCRGGRCAGRGGREAGLGAAPAAAPQAGGWGPWSPWPDCASGCLHSDAGRLSAGSTGIMISNRRCDQPRPDHGGTYCDGHIKRYRTCTASQCLNVPRMTISEFSDQICARAREVDADLIGTGFQRYNSDASDACAVWCHTRGGGLKSRGWTFPDGTTCQTKMGKKPMHCISGLCVEFKCSNSEELEYSSNLGQCAREIENSSGGSSGGTSSNSVSAGTSNSGGSGQWRRSSGPQWHPASGCHYHCVSPGSGIRLVKSKGSQPKNSIQLCRPDELGCGRLKTPHEHATYVCTKYKERVRRLSGSGMQISPALEDPDRPCRIACQDEAVSHRFYLVNGQEGWFPFGTSCNKQKPAYCISGKCLEFGSDDTPLSETEFTLPLLPRNNKTTSQLRPRPRDKRSALKYDKPIRIKATLDQAHLDEIISTLNFSGMFQPQIDNDEKPDLFIVDFNNPVFVAPDDSPRAGRHYINWEY